MDVERGWMWREDGRRERMDVEREDGCRERG